MPSQPPTGRSLALGLGSLALIPVLVLVDYAWASSRGWELVSRLDRMVIHGALGILGITLALVLTHWGRRFLINYSRRLRLMLVAGTMAIALCESCLAYLGLGRREAFHYFPPHTKAVFHPDPEIMPGISGESRFTTNSQGLRGPEFPTDRKTYRILTIGGSTTECTYLDDAKAWPAVLMQQLNQQGVSCWVGSAGKSGMAAVHHRLFLQESILANEIDCLVLLVGVNDFGRGFKGISVNVALPENSPVWSRSRIFSMVRTVWYLHGNFEAFIPDDIGQNVALGRLPRQQTTEFVEELPDLEPYLTEYARELRFICATCRKRNVPVFFASQPVLWAPDLPQAGLRLLYEGYMNDGSFLSVRALRRGMDRYNRLLKTICRQEGAGFVDLSALSGQVKYFYDDCHFTIAGSRQVANLIARQLMIDKPWLTR